MSANINKTLQKGEVKVLRDPVHEYIHIKEEIIWNLIDTREFQRLRRIHQLGGSYQVYHGAEHSRFSHSLGVYEVARRMIEEVKGLKQSLTRKEQLAVLCAALLHDLGHGPFSHAFESVVNVNHEELTIRVILEDTQVNKVLKRVSKDFPRMVADIISHQHERKLLTQIVSSQLDADRMDYLLRDSYFCGVSYGSYDIERILRTMRVYQDRLVIKESGINAVEDYIMARYQMYWQVYFHPTSRSFEMMLTKIFESISQVYENDPQFVLTTIPYFKGFVDKEALSIEDHLSLDEFSVIHGFKSLAAQENYPILKDLAYRLIHRNLFDYVDFSGEAREWILRRLKQSGFDKNIYYGDDVAKQRPYKIDANVLYEELDENVILVQLQDGSVVELSKVSTIVNATSKAKLKRDRKIFAPREVIHEYLSTKKNPTA